MKYTANEDIIGGLMDGEPDALDAVLSKPEGDYKQFLEELERAVGDDTVQSR